MCVSQSLGLANVYITGKALEDIQKEIESVENQLSEIQQQIKDGKFHARYGAFSIKKVNQQKVDEFNKSTPWISVSVFIEEVYCEYTNLFKRLLEIVQLRKASNEIYLTPDQCLAINTFRERVGKD